MGRLHCVLLLTPDLARQREFYRDRLGLEPSRADDSLTSFAVRGAALVLRAQDGGGKPELRLAITASALESRIATARARGARVGEIAQDEICRMALAHDPEGNAVQIVEPIAEFARGQWPHMSRAIVIASKFDETIAFYREALGLKVADEDEHRVEFDTGETRLCVHDADDPDAPQLYADQRIAFAFEDGEFESWVGELRGRGVKFATAPAETEMGPQAEIEDADGWLVVLHGPAPEEVPDDDELSAEYGGDEDDDRGLPRRGGEIGGEASRKFLPAAKLARKQAARASKAPTPELDRGGFVPRSPRPYTPRPEGAPRPFTPRPEGTRPAGPPREGGPRPGPRTGGPPRPDRGRGE